MASVEEIYQTLGVTHTPMRCNICTITTQEPIKKLKWKK